MDFLHLIILPNKGLYEPAGHGYLSIPLLQKYPLGHGSGELPPYLQYDPP